MSVSGGEREMAAIDVPREGARLSKSLAMTAQRRLWNRVTQIIFTACALILVVVIAAIILYISSKGLATFITNKVPLTQFLFSKTWAPDEKPGTFGAATFIVGSLEVTFL